MLQELRPLRAVLLQAHRVVHLQDDPLVHSKDLLVTVLLDHHRVTVPPDVSPLSLCVILEHSLLAGALSVSTAAIRGLQTAGVNPAAGRGFRSRDPLACSK